MTKVNINIVTSELVYDIHNKTFLTGKSRFGKEPELVANMQSNDDEEDLNQILRSIQRAVGILKTKLSDYIVETKTSASNVQITSTDSLSFTVQMPSNYNTATVDAVANSIHNFIVNTAVGDWFGITNKDDASDYVKEADNNILEIREAANKRKRPSRPTPSTTTSNG